MIQLAVVAAVAAVVGGIVAVTSRNTNLLGLGLFLAMVAAPLASSPEPPTLAIAFRILGAMLAAYLLAASARSQAIVGEGSGFGVVAEAAVVAAAFGAGWFVVPVKPLVGPVAAQAAGIALIVLAVAPLTGRNVLRAGTGVALLTLGITLLLQAWAGPASPLEEILLTALLVGVAGATSLLMSPMEPIASKRPAAVKLSVPARSSAASNSATESAPAVVAGLSGKTALAPEPAIPPLPPAARRAARPADPTPPALPERPAPNQPLPNLPSPRSQRLHPREPRR